MVLERKIFIVFPIISLWKYLIPAWGQFRPQGLDWPSLYKGLLDIAIYQIYMYKL